MRFLSARNVNAVTGMATAFCLLSAPIEAWQTPLDSNRFAGPGCHQQRPVERDASTVSRPKMERRDILAAGVLGVSSLAFPPVLAVNAEEGQDLTSQLFNSDGSLKAGVITEEAKSRTIELKWEVSDTSLFAIDGIDSQSSAKNGDSIRLSYQVPDKWGANENDLYIDSSEGVNIRACKRITVYKASGSTKLDRLEKATSIGVGNALDVPPSLDRIRTSDLIGGRKTSKDGQKYYEFDLASAPATCGDSATNLGLGFCPFDTVYLLSATILGGNLYVISVECDDQEWKQGSADLKRVRSSFQVEDTS